MRNKPFQDLTGKTFGRWTVVGFSHAGKHGSTMWECRCECGKMRVVERGGLVKGRSQSCGCRHKEIISKTFTTHGLSGTPEHEIWMKMRDRCSNPNLPRAHCYYGKGIKVLYASFEEFLADVGPRPSPAHSIDRIDGNRHYEPGNCRWATPKEQANNTAWNHRIAHDGKTLTLTEWAAIRGMAVNTLIYRIKRGWSPERALTQAVQKRTRHANVEA